MTRECISLVGEPVVELVFQHLLLPEGVSPQEKGICRTGKTIDTLPLPNPEGIYIRKWGGSEERGKQYSIPLLPLMIPKPQDQPELRGRKVGVRHLQLGVFQAFFVCFCFLKFYQLIIWGFILFFSLKFFLYPLYLFPSLHFLFILNKTSSLNSCYFLEESYSP